MKWLIPVLIVAALAFVSDAQAHFRRTPRRVVVERVVVPRAVVVREFRAVPFHGINSFAAPVYGVQPFAVQGSCGEFFLVR